MLLFFYGNNNHHHKVILSHTIPIPPFLTMTRSILLVAVGAFLVAGQRDVPAQLATYESNTTQCWLEPVSRLRDGSQRAPDSLELFLLEEKFRQVALDFTNCVTLVAVHARGGKGLAYSLFHYHLVCFIF